MVIGLLIKEVEQPKMETVGDNYKLALICMHEQLPAVIDMIISSADHIVIAPYVPETKMAPAVFRAPRPVHVPTAFEKDITYLPMKQRRVRGGANTRDTATGKTVLAAFNDGSRVKHPADFAEALDKAGYSSNSYSSVVNRLVDEGDLIRVGHGAYRLPAAHDVTSSRDE